MNWKSMAFNCSGRAKYGLPMAALLRLATALGSLSRSAAASPLNFLFPSSYRKYRPEQHYMRGPGPKWRAKHLSDGASSQKS